MDVDEFEDYLELQDPKVQRLIEESRRESLADKNRNARALLTELEVEDEKDRKGTKKKTARRQTV